MVSVLRRAVPLIALRKSELLTGRTVWLEFISGGSIPTIGDTGLACYIRCIGSATSPCGLVPLLRYTNLLIVFVSACRL